MNLLEYIKEKDIFDNIDINHLKDSYKNIKELLKKSTVDMDKSTLDSFDFQIKELDHFIQTAHSDLQKEFYGTIQPNSLRKSFDCYDRKKYQKLGLVENDYWDLELQQRVLSATKNYVNFQYPGLEITPRSKIWTKNLTALDPLFVVSKDLDVVDDIISQFHPIYQRRVRVYDYENANLKHLPQNAFSFVFSWNYFEYLPYNLIDRYFASIYDLMLPGGTFMLSYADCLLKTVAEQFESDNYGFMTKELLDDLVNENNFKLIKEENYQYRISWAILRKPGELPKPIKEVPSVGYLKNSHIDPIP